MAGLDLNAIQKLCSPQVQNAISKQQAGKYSSRVNRPTQAAQPVYQEPLQESHDYGFDDPLLAGGVSMGGYTQESTEGIPYQANSYEPSPEQYRAKLNEMNLPEAIKKSLMEQQVTLSETAAPAAGDAIEQMLLKNGINAAQQRQLAQVQSPIVNEQVKPQAPVSAYMQQQPQGFDYQTLRLVINECLESKLNELKMLNESKLNDIVLKEGKIRLIDNKGNIYVAPLQKQGNINDKK